VQLMVRLNGGRYMVPDLGSSRGESTTSKSDSSSQNVSRPHSRQLSQRTSRLIDCNFIVRLLQVDVLTLYRTDLTCFTESTLSFHLLNY